ncbi:unnamed protein product [Urochloa decumbens]|uniref:Uncharacterized protein n=1 Tax=Urochloa decumbens TaxID=240449 RepID=A0ABC9C6M1_9POAL
MSRRLVVRDPVHQAVHRPPLIIARPVAHLRVAGRAPPGHHRPADRRRRLSGDGVRPCCRQLRLGDDRDGDVSAGAPGGDAPAADRARGVRQQPGIDALGVERVAASRQDAEKLVGVERAQAHGALGGAAGAGAGAGTLPRPAAGNVAEPDRRERADGGAAEPGAAALAGGWREAEAQHAGPAGAGDAVLAVLGVHHEEEERQKHGRDHAGDGGHVHGHGRGERRRRPRVLDGGARGMDRSWEKIRMASCVGGKIGGVRDEAERTGVEWKETWEAGGKPGFPLR